MSDKNEKCNDRELLEMAAKAMHGTPSFKGDVKKFVVVGCSGWYDPMRVKEHAFITAFVLGMDVDFQACRIIYGDNDSELEFDGSDGGISNAMHAITRAAAEIGSAM